MIRHNLKLKSTGNKKLAHNGKMGSTLGHALNMEIQLRFLNPEQAELFCMEMY